MRILQGVLAHYYGKSASQNVFDLGCWWLSTKAYNSKGAKVATYTYSDAWGNHSVSYSNGGNSTGSQYNPFRYRGYYYDTDLGMYYLQSRYYDPNTYRFINADSALYPWMLR